MNSDRHLIFLTRIVDSRDPVGGFTIDWIEHIARHMPVAVICQQAGSYNFSGNVRVFSLGKEKYRSRLYYLFNYYRHFIPLLFNSRGVFGHMCPIYTVLAWPARITGKKIVMWYSHRLASGPVLDLAVRLSSRIYSIGFPYFHPKVRIVNHGVNCNFFSYRQNIPESLEILVLGRISRIKNILPVIHAANLLSESGQSFHMKIVGGTRTADDDSYLNELKNELSTGCAASVEFVDSVPHRTTIDYYSNSRIFVDMMAYGPNKTLIEAASCGIPVLMPGNWLGLDNGLAKLAVCPAEPEELAKRITLIHQMAGRDIEEMRKKISESVHFSFSLESLAESIANEFRLY
ncbi:MAG: glycosyltransferase family 4 protein [Candidatus Wallbacteria bacterium]|nr:glycosyltransferase family 4 protein [Candidatus Wallbacteria bacterium]